MADPGDFVSHTLLMEVGLKTMKGFNPGVTRSEVGWKMIHSRVKMENGLESVLVKILLVEAPFQNKFDMENVHPFSHGTRCVGISSSWVGSVAQLCSHRPKIHLSLRDPQDVDLVFCLASQSGWLPEFRAVDVAMHS